MKLFNLSILTILSFTSSTAYAAGCFVDNSYASGNPTLAVSKVKELCRQYIGNVPANYNGYNCHYIGGIPYAITARNLGNTEAYFAADTCTDHFTKVLSCLKGGDFKWFPWQFIMMVKASGSCNN
ncbi:hypothetical protein DSL72_000037 [Monilinia vaccinii-corymbosi]|uniref:Secreted protein n=1 Tax=Monilinia vaccinii-corymbosi TaxID=61207 RepID=A0A8A3NY80_9HELO|nr:hypothetical protein DSL72_000037 [Monilinia vaccinii-corymbosi]